MACTIIANTGELFEFGNSENFLSSETGSKARVKATSLTRWSLLFFYLDFGSRGQGKL